LVGKTAQKLPDGSYDYSDSMLKDTRGISVAVGEVCPLPGGGFPYWRNEKNSNFIYSNTVKKAVPIYQEYYQKDTAYPYPVFSVADAQAVNDIRKDLDVYLAECEAKFITGGMSFDKWDEYVQTCNKMGIQKLESYFQKAYDTIAKAK
jgi:putative aldouronate transport system substrate-binding protein